MTPETGEAASSAPALLEPGTERGYAVAGDAAVLAALVAAETAWLAVLVENGCAPAGLVDSLDDSLRRRPLDLLSAAGRAAEGGNPVIPLVDDLRARLGSEGSARFVHRGLTSQDALDTALVLVARDALDDVAGSLRRAGDALAGLAEEHRTTVMMGRTLTQHAVPITFGLKASQWLTSVAESVDETQACRAQLPVQCGGAAGTLAGVGVAARTDTRHLEGPLGDTTAHPDPLDLAARWAERLDLTWPGAPWHTRRRPVTRIGDTLAAVVSALGHVATDVATLSRPELGEVGEGLAPGHGRSSTMPHKRNPVLSVLVRAAGLQAGPLAGVLHQCTALAVDERSDGAWHAEWPTLQRLLVLAVTAADQTAALVEGLTVDAGAMDARVGAAGDVALAEWRGLSRGLDAAPQVPGGATAAAYLGSSTTLTDDAVRRWRERTHR
jgi:3-carboxy-cis,cis-muconate cycloisomerase